MSTTSGIDVSRWQGDIKWEMVAAAGYRFAVIRATVGETYTDPRFHMNWAGARNAGLLVSVYHVVKPEHPADSQVARLLDALGDRRADLPLVLDIELHGGLGPADITACINDCLRKVEQTSGRKPIIYTAKWFWNSHVLPSPEWSAYDLWVAHYGVSAPALPTGWSEWRFWQYSDKGSVPGVSAGSTDLNWYAGTYEDLLKYAGTVLQPRPGVGLRARVSVPTLNLRNGPDVNYTDIGDLHAGDVVSIIALDGQDVWVEIEQGKWAAFASHGERYMELEGARARVSVPTLNIRNSPSTGSSDIGDLHLGDSVNIIGLDGKDVWAEIEPGKWAAFAAHGERYMQLEEVREVEELKRTARFQIYRDSQGEYRWRLRAANGEIIADSNEGYIRRSDCEHGIDLVKHQASDAAVEDQT